MFDTLTGLPAFQDQKLLVGLSKADAERAIAIEAMDTNIIFLANSTTPLT